MKVVLALLLISLAISHQVETQSQVYSGKTFFDRHEQ